MARKKIFIYLSLVVSAITFLTSTGRAVKTVEFGDLMLNAAQRQTGAFSLQKSDGFDKTDMEKAIRRSREEQAQKQEQDLNQAIKRSREDTELQQAIALSREDTELQQAIARSLAAQAQLNTGAVPLRQADGGFDQKQMQKAIALSREDTELQQAIALSLKEQELQKARESQLGFIPKTGLTNKDFKERLSEIEKRRTTGTSLKTVGNYNVLITKGDGFCGLHCLGIVPHDALALINQACNQRNLDGNQIASLTNAQNAITQLHGNKKSDNWLELNHVKTMANLVLQKQIRFHYDGADIGHQDTVKRFNDDTDPYNGTIWVHFSGNHYSKMVEK